MSLCSIERTVICRREVDVQRLDVIRILAFQSLDLILHRDIDIAGFDGLFVFFLEFFSLSLLSVDLEQVVISILIEIETHLLDDILKSFDSVERKRRNPVKDRGIVI